MDSQYRKMSPLAKKAALQSERGVSDAITALVELSPSANQKTVDDLVARAGGAVKGWSPQSRTLTLDIAPDKLSDLATDRAVTYVDVGGRFGTP